MSRSVLIVSTNWIGDVVMGMPAVQRFKQENPDSRITILSKPSTRALWEMFPGIDEIQPMAKPLETAQRLRPQGYDCVYVFPNSFRSAVVPWLAGISQRLGRRGHWRSLFLSKVIETDKSLHQQLEYKKILGVEGELAHPRISVPDNALQHIQQQLTELDSSKQLITLLPGAARGPSKRWPPESYIQLAEKLLATGRYNVVLSGGPDDAQSCEQMAQQLGAGVINFAGKTSIAQWAALLQLSDCTVANDSGGMHLSTAVGTPVVGIFGITDPDKTGPLGHSVVLQKSEIKDRKVSRHSEEAIKALGAIKAEEAFDAVMKLLAEDE